MASSLSGILHSTEQKNLQNREYKAGSPYILRHEAELNYKKFYLQLDCKCTYVKIKLWNYLNYSKQISFIQKKYKGELAWKKHFNLYRIKH